MQLNPISGPTKHPKNQLTYLKFHGTIKTVQGNGLPPFEADIVDSGAWAQEDHLSSGEVWVKTEHFALLRHHPITNSLFFEPH